MRVDWNAYVYVYSIKIVFSQQLTQELFDTASSRNLSSGWSLIGGLSLRLYICPLLLSRMR